MTNPWLNIPLADYEGHMVLPAVGQAEMLAAEFKALLNGHAPRSTRRAACIRAGYGAKRRRVVRVGPST